MMSCFEGVLEYYKVVKDEKLLTAVKNFVDMVEETDFTIIGSCGCTHELFDNSTEKQTEYSVGIMQETCVTVTLIKLCAKLYLFTGDVKYIRMIERSGYNALFGAVNNENQTMVNSKGSVWIGDTVTYPEHESFPFDSYSPLYKGKRGKAVGGFQLLQDGRSYGCCACIGSAGTAIFALVGAVKSFDGIYLNLYNNMKIKTDFGGKTVKVSVNANPYKNGNAKISVCGEESEFTVYLRVPEWADDYTLNLNGKPCDIKAVDGYIAIKRKWNEDVLSVKCSTPVKATVKNGKIAFTKGAIVLASDKRIADLNKPFTRKVKDGKTVRSCVAFNARFNSNVCVEVDFGESFSLLCDYSQAGKNYDDENSGVTVWHDLA